MELILGFIQLVFGQLLLGTFQFISGLLDGSLNLGALVEALLAPR